MLHLKLVTGLREGPLQDVCPSNNDIHDTTHQLFMEDYKHPQDYVTDNSTTRYFLKYLTDNITLANVSICGMYQLKFSGMCSEYLDSVVIPAFTNAVDSVTPAWKYRV